MSTVPLPEFVANSSALLDESAYRELIDKVDTGFAVIDLEFKDGRAVDYWFRQVNSAFVRITGIIDAIDQNIRSLLPDIEEFWIRSYGEVALSGRRFHFEHEVKALNGFFSVEAFRIGRPEQRRVGVMFHDITRHKRIERELAESEARFSALADGLPMPVWVLDSDGVLRFANSAYSEFFGIELGNGETVRWSELLHPQDLSVFEFELSQALQNQRGMHALVRVRRHDGRWRWTEMSAVPRHAADGGFIGLAGSSPDVTERREMELAREQMLESERTARNTAEKVARLKDDFLATLSHELRTPLTTILGWSDLLLQRIDANDPSRKGLSVIASSARAQKRLISDMLDLSSMLLGKLQLEVEPLDVLEQLQEAMGALEPTAHDKSQTLTLRSSPGNYRVLGDAMRLQQVFWNLLSNAIKFTPEHGRIELEVTRQRDQVVVHVRDSGDGIASDFLPHLFTRFRQADGSATRRHGGLGLGLAIVQQLVELHGGQVQAASEGQGLGSSFSVMLPEIPNHVDLPGRPSKPASVPETLLNAMTLSGLHILVVEDQAEVREYLARLLEQQGAKVTCVHGAAEAIAALDGGSHHDFSLLLTDIGMHGMDGYGLIRTIREDLELSAKELPAVALTALVRRDDRDRALASGFQAHLGKPCTVPQLVATVRSLCSPS